MGSGTNLRRRSNQPQAFPSVTVLDFLRHHTSGFATGHNVLGMFYGSRAPTKDPTYLPYDCPLFWGSDRLRAPNTGDSRNAKMTVQRARARPQETDEDRMGRRRRKSLYSALTQIYWFQHSH